MSAGSLHVIIIGAGTGGLCLAHGLKRAGISVAVYERDCTRTDGLQGYRVGISPDGSRALRQCLPPDLYGTFVATCARAPKHFNMLTERFSEVLSIDLRPETDSVNSEKSVSRMTLRQVLLTGLEDLVHFDKKFTHYEQHSDGRITVFFEDGSWATGDLLVAADGASSRVRKQFLPRAVLEDSGLLAIGGKLPLSDETKALLPPKVFHGISMVMAPKGYSLILHVMEFKWDRDGVMKHGIGGNDTELLSRWPGLLFDNTRDYIMWGFSAARQNFKIDPLLLKGDDLKQLVLSMTTSWHPNLRTLISQSDPSTLFTVNIRTSVPIEPWETSNVTLLGDAIHTMTPGRGVGANTALRDAALLCTKLIDARDAHKPVKQAVHEYEAEMIKYGFEAVLESRKQMDGRDPIHKPVIGRLLLAGMRAGMHVVNAVPALKRRMAHSLESVRGHDREEHGPNGHPGKHA